MARCDINDKQWQKLQELLPPQRSKKRGRPYKEHRRVFNGILWVLRTGAPWRDLPERYGPWQTCFDRFLRWKRDGTWTAILQALQAKEDAQGNIDWDSFALDSSSIKAHPHAAGARHAPAKKRGTDACWDDACDKEALGKSRGGLTTKVHLVAEGKARPVSLCVSEGQVHDSKEMEATLEAVRVPRKGRGRPRKRPGKLRADKGYSYVRCRKALRRRGIRHLIPERKDQKEQRQKKGRAGGRPVEFVKAEYAKRNVVERCILRLKQFRRVATRYEKRASSYLALVTIASIMLWLR